MKLRRLASTAMALGVSWATLMRADVPQPPMIPLWPEGVPGLRTDAAPDVESGEHVQAVHEPTITVFPAPEDRFAGTSVVVCPGGGYQRLAWRKEGTEIAAWLNSIGVTAFVLRYRAVEYGHPAPLRDVTRAIRMVRWRSADLGVVPTRVGVLGFSAGGHLAACASTMFDDPVVNTGSELDALSARPDFAILLYAVITFQEPHLHRGSREALLGTDAPPDLVARMSVESRVTAAAPATFLMHTCEDASVPAENALMYFGALKLAGVPAELHIYEQGAHGMGMRPGPPAAEAWPRACAEWMQARGLLVP